MKNTNSSFPHFFFDSKPVYFAFPDNVLDYDCSSCGAKCCRGHGFAASMDRELPGLLTRFPELAYTAIRHSGNWTQFFNLPGNCFLLDGGHSCSIENQLGKTMKPGVCRAFPFNNISSSDNLLIIAPHFLCPLNLTQNNSGLSHKGSHAEIFQELLETGILANHSMHNKLCINEPIDSFLNKEVILRDICTQNIGHQNFSSSISGLSCDKTAHNLSISRAERLMGLDRCKKLPAEMTDDFLLALAPMFSISFSDLPVLGRLKALALTESLLRTIFALNNNTLSLQGLAITFDHVASIIHLFTCEHTQLPDRANTSPNTTSLKLLNLKDPQISMAAAIVIRLIQRGVPPLEALEEAVPPEMPIVNRMVLFQALGRHLKRYWHEQTESVSSPTTEIHNLGPHASSILPVPPCD